MGYTRGRRMLKKVGSRLRSVTKKRDQGHFPVMARKKPVEIIKLITVKVEAPYFVNSETENRTK